MVAPVPTSERSDGFQPPSTPKPAFAPTPAPTGRLAAVQEMARWLRLLFETEREFVRTATTLIYRVGEPELKYLLCQHVWEAASHARFLRERGRELSGFGATDDVRPSLRQLFNEAVMPADATVALAGFYRVIKPALHDAYRHYLTATHHLADWPSRKLVEEFLADEARHAAEIAPYLPVAASACEPTSASASASEWSAHLTTLLASHGGLHSPAPPLPVSPSPPLSLSPSSAPPLLSATVCLRLVPTTRCIAYLRPTPRIVGVRVLGADVVKPVGNHVVHVFPHAVEKTEFVNNS